MSKLFFAKMNINADIYDVYNDVKSLDDLLKKVYIGVNNKTIIYDDKGGRYKFFDLDLYEDNSRISGRLGFIKKGIHSTYDPDKDTAIDKEDNNKIEYITFYLDVYNEMLAFTVTPSLTKKKVLDTFSKLIKESSDIGVVFVLETDIRKLESEIKKMKILRRVSLNLVPPNGDKDQFGRLFSLNANTVAGSGATQLKQSYGTLKKEGLNKDSELISNAIDGITLGYADGKFEGKDFQEENFEINTEDDTPYSRYIRDNQNKDKSVISEKGRAGIVDLLAYKAQVREKNNGDTGRK